MNDKGFTLIETLLSLLITSVCILLLTGSISLIKNINYDLKYVDDNIHLKQIRLNLALSNDVRIEGDNLLMKYLGNDVEYKIINNKLVLTPGYQVYLDNIDNCSFFKDDKGIYLKYNRKNKIYERIIYYEK